MKIKSFILASLLSITPAYCNLPVVDIGSITQAVAGYVQQIKDIIMYEKQLEQMRIDLVDFNSMLDSLKGGWDDLTSMADGLGNINNCKICFKKQNHNAMN